MSDTPRTDAVAVREEIPGDYNNIYIREKVSADFARQLERELQRRHELACDYEQKYKTYRDELANVNQAAENMARQADADIKQLRSQLDQAKAERDAWKRRAEGMKLGNENYARENSILSRKISDQNLTLAELQEELEQAKEIRERLNRELGQANLARQMFAKDLANLSADHVRLQSAIQGVEHGQPGWAATVDKLVETVKGAQADSRRLDWLEDPLNQNRLFGYFIKGGSPQSVRNAIDTAINK